MGKFYGADSFLPKFESCCCCFTLKAGTLFIGCVFLILGILSVPWGYRSASDFLSGHAEIKTAGQLIVAVVFVESQILVILTTIAAFILVTGLCLGAPDFLVPFILALIASIVQNVFVIIIAFFEDVRKDMGTLTPMREYGDVTPFDSQISLAVNALLNVYLCAVVNSCYIFMKGPASFDVTR